MRLLIPRPRPHLHPPPRLLPLSAPAPANASSLPHLLCWPLRLSPISPPDSALRSPPRRRASPSRAGGPTVFPPSTLASFVGRLPLSSLLYSSSSISSPSPQNPRRHQPGRLCGVVLRILMNGSKTSAAATRLAGDLSHHLFKVSSACFSCNLGPISFSLLARMVLNSPHRHQYYRTKDIPLSRFSNAFFPHIDGFLSTAYLRTLHTTFAFCLYLQLCTACLF